MPAVRERSRSAHQHAQSRARHVPSATMSGTATIASLRSTIVAACRIAIAT
jgi:hypothetical protein